MNRSVRKGLIRPVGWRGKATGLAVLVVLVVAAAATIRTRLEGAKLARNPAALKDHDADVRMRAAYELG